MPPRRSSRKPKPTARYSAYKKTLVKKSGKPTKTLTKAIQKVVKGTQESKFIISAPYNYNSSASLEDFTQFSTAITATSEIYSLIPPLNVGDDDFERIGNQIQPTSLTTKIQCALGGLSSTRLYVDFYFLTSKNVKDGRKTTSVPIDKLLNNGQGQNIGYDGLSFTSMMPVNKTEFSVIKHKRVLLKKGNNDNNTLYSGGSTPAIESSPSFKSFTVKIPLPKKLMYEEKNDTVPTNTFPFMVVGFTSADQFGDNITNTLPLYVQAQSQMYYKDA